MPDANKPLSAIEAVLESIEFEAKQHLHLAHIHQEKASTLKEQHEKLRLAIQREQERSSDCAGR